MAGIKDGVLYGEFLVEDEKCFCFIAINKISASSWKSTKNVEDVFNLEFTIVAEGIRYTFLDKISTKASELMNSLIKEIMTCNHSNDTEKLMAIKARFPSSDGTIRSIERK